MKLAIMQYNAKGQHIDGLTDKAVFVVSSDGWIYQTGSDVMSAFDESMNEDNFSDVIRMYQDGKHKLLYPITHITQYNKEKNIQERISENYNTISLIIAKMQELGRSFISKTTLKEALQLSSIDNATVIMNDLAEQGILKKQYSYWVLTPVVKEYHSLMNKDARREKRRAETTLHIKESQLSIVEHRKKHSIQPPKEGGVAAQATELLKGEDDLRTEMEEAERQAERDLQQAHEPAAESKSKNIRKKSTRKGK